MKKMVLAALLLSAPAMAEKPVTHKLVIDGTTFYVRHKVKEGTAAVFWTGMKASNAMRWMNAKEAASQATGCRVVDTMTRDVTLYAKLDCPAAPM